MAFSEDEEEEPRRRRRSRGRGEGAEAPLPDRAQPLSWAILPPEEEEEEGTGSAAGTVSAAETPAAPAAEDWRSRYQYLLAEFDNYRRRVQKETEAAVAAARGKVLLKVVALHEGIEGALASLPPEAKALREGLMLILRNMDAMMKEEGVEPVASEGARFEPEVHEAVGQSPATPKAPEGTVAVVVQQGYRGPTGLLRPAKVLVAAKASPR
ncbi:MAG: nucleotide exchange factor GrpE [Euryarchaeota archaeon]|nr:nucleotide exchange factor GrpE [Euryarchaeota archaeon]MDE1837832.1 nucleotide exchange factor GrpE [Euryarchaeota archaeon]MDE1880106.1 nucleotide exchange factor GrpE [Euryarchaeota archaeon]MDE2045056.1 nucleotide exchange factor GrpE [Thermoplasmata archaeon]